MTMLKPPSCLLSGQFRVVASSSRGAGVVILERMTLVAIMGLYELN